jgi:hypothetical protein
MLGEAEGDFGAGGGGVEAETAVQLFVEEGFDDFEAEAALVVGGEAAAVVADEDEVFAGGTAEGDGDLTFGLVFEGVFEGVLQQFVDDEDQVGGGAGPRCKPPGGRSGSASITAIAAPIPTPPAESSPPVPTPGLFTGTGTVLPALIRPPGRASPPRKS